MRERDRSGAIRPRQIGSAPVEAASQHPLPAQTSVMVKRGELPEPTSATHLATLRPLKHVGGKMPKEACLDPAKAKYIGECHSGNRVWGELGAVHLC